MSHHPQDPNTRTAQVISEILAQNKGARTLEALAQGSDNPSQQRLLDAAAKDARDEGRARD